ncbi:MAG: hypothetical protein NTX22_02075 [Ignavibacteriales bacterium]|nr:hypothetical protein [Ignavibacteriales bacterium]
MLESKVFKKGDFYKDKGLVERKSKEGMDHFFYNLKSNYYTVSSNG